MIDLYLQMGEASLVSYQIAELEIEYKSDMLLPTSSRKSDMLPEGHIGALVQHT